MQECIFNQVPQPVEFFVIFTLYIAVFLWWNDSLHALLFSLFNEGIAVVATIRQQMLGGDAFNQA